MANFPILTSGAVAQYPLEAGAGQSSQVIRFLDGADQRYLMQGRSLRRWLIRLELLNDGEIQALESFFEAQLGSYSPFVFPDPISGTEVQNCRLAADTLTIGYESVGINSSAFWIVETNG